MNRIYRENGGIFSPILHSFNRISIDLRPHVQSLGVVNFSDHMVETWNCQIRGLLPFQENIYSQWLGDLLIEFFELSVGFELF